MMMNGNNFDIEKRFMTQGPIMDTEKRMIIQSAQESLSKKDKEIQELRMTIDDLRRKQQQMSRTIASQADTLAKQAETIAYFTSETTAPVAHSFTDNAPNDSIAFKDALDRSNNQNFPSLEPFPKPFPRNDFNNKQMISNNQPPQDNGTPFVGYSPSPQRNASFGNYNDTANVQTPMIPAKEHNFMPPEVNNNPNRPYIRSPMFNNQTKQDIMKRYQNELEQKAQESTVKDEYPKQTSSPPPLDNTVSDNGNMNFVGPDHAIGYPTSNENVGNSLIHNNLPPTPQMKQENNQYESHLNVLPTKQSDNSIRKRGRPRKLGSSGISRRGNMGLLKRKYKRAMNTDTESNQNISMSSEQVQTNNVPMNVNVDGKKLKRKLKKLGRGRPVGSNKIKNTSSENTGNPQTEKSKPFSCSKCAYSSTQKGSLKNHERSVHDKIKPFECTECSYAAALKQNLKVHLKNVHNGKKQNQIIQQGTNSQQSLQSTQLPTQQQLNVQKLKNVFPLTPVPNVLMDLNPSMTM